MRNFHPPRDRGPDPSGEEKGFLACTPRAWRGGLRLDLVGVHLYFRGAKSRAWRPHPAGFWIPALQICRSDKVRHLAGPAGREA